MSTIYLAIDPGLRKTGVALGKGTELHAAAVVKNSLKPDDKAGHVAECVAMAKAVRDWVRKACHQPGICGDGIGGAFVPEVLVFEWPRAYRPGKQSGDQNDLLPMCGVDGAIAALFPEEHFITHHPDAWKGQVDKTTMLPRILKRLSVEEQSRIERLPRGGLSHDCMDAVGIFLKEVGRLERHRVVP